MTVEFDIRVSNAVDEHPWSAWILGDRSETEVFGDSRADVVYTLAEETLAGRDHEPGFDDLEIYDDYSIRDLGVKFDVAEASSAERVEFDAGEWYLVTDAGRIKGTPIEEEP